MNTAITTLQSIAQQPDESFWVDEGPFEPGWNSSIYLSIIHRLQAQPIKPRLQALLPIEHKFATKPQLSLGTAAQQILDLHSINRVTSLPSKEQIEYINRKDGLCIDCLCALAKEGGKEVRLAIANLKRSFDSVFHILSTAEEWEIRKTLSHNPWLPSQALNTLWQSDGRTGEIAAAISIHRNTDADLLDQIVIESTDAAVLSRAAGHSALSPTSQLILYQANDYMFQLAGNASCISSILEELSTSDSHMLRRSVAYNPFATAQILIRLSQDPNVQVRKAIASRTYLPNEKTAVPDIAFNHLLQDTELEILETLLQRHRGRWSSAELKQLKTNIAQRKKSLQLQGHPDFSGSKGPRRKRNINLQLVRDLCASNSLSKEELTAMLIEHKAFLASDDGKGTWSRNNIADLPLTIYLGSTATEGKQLQLRNLKIPSGVSLSGHDLRYSNLTGAVCENIDLSNTRLEKSVLTDGIWSGTNFDGANLSHTDFSGSDLRGASFVGANLTAADFEQTDCTGADFTNAILHKSKWRSAILDDITR